MVKKHMKRLAAPQSWPIQRKRSAFVTRPKPSGHSFALGLPLTIILKEILCYAVTTKEAEKILRNQKVLVDGMRRIKGSFLVGLMDSLEFPDIKTAYRMLVNTKGKLALVKISGEEAGLKLCKIDDKKMLPGGKMQINLHDGRNILAAENSYKTGDSLLIKVPSQEIAGHFALEKGAQAILTGGSHVGEIATIEQIEHEKITVKAKEGTYETLKKLAFVVGKEKPAISLGD